MKILNLMKILLLCVMTAGLASCGDDNYYTITGNTKTDTHDFTWKWIDNSREGLILNYGSGDVKIFENVWVREHYLSGKLDGEIMMLTASRYMVNQNWK